MLMVMDSNQLPYIPPPRNQYDFITQQGKPPKKSLMGGDPFIKKIIIIVGGAIGLMIVAAIAVSLFAGGGGTDGLKKIVQQQQELVRVASIGTEKAQGQTVRGLAVTTEFSVASGQQALTDVLSKRGVELSKEELALAENTQTDQLLEAAVTNNRFDEAFEKELEAQITDYLQALRTAYANTTHEETKTVLSTSIDNAQRLLGPDTAAQ